ncbi:MAG: hypothetical protein ACR2K3_06660 [Nocardioides sp.]
MTKELTAFNERSQAAERVGDAAEALAYHSGIPMFRRSRHRAMLEQLVDVADELTPWIWARWIVCQALRAEDTGSRTATLQRLAMRDAVETFHADLMDAAYDEGDDPIQVVARVLGESWAMHQLAAHDYHGLESFLDEFADGALAERAELARSWVGAAMGGYRVGRATTACALTAFDVSTQERLDVLDLGAGGVGGPDRWVIGRLVPSGTAPALMFDTAPLVVDEVTAREVAHRRSHPGGWVEAVRDALDEGRIEPGQLLREDYELVTDVLSLGLVEFATPAAELPRVMAQLRDGRDEVGRAAFRVLRSAAEGSLDEEAAPYVAAAVLNVHAHGEAQRTILAARQQERWSHWAALVTDPARSRLLGFARATADAA